MFPLPAGRRDFVVATDKYTVTFNWKQGAVGPTSILTIMEAAGADNSIECPDAVTAYTLPLIRKLQTGTMLSVRPYMLTDFVIPALRHM